MGRYLVFDSETETHHSYKRTANPFDERNWVVMRGWKHRGDPQCSMEYFPSIDRKSYLRIADDVTILIGFNIKFDLMYELVQGNPDLLAFFKRGGKVWDCQYAEYLIRAQHPDAQMCSLDSIVESYGGRKKIDEVKQMWEAGILTSQINPDLLTDYLIGTEAEKRNSGDIGNTELIYLGQVKKAFAQAQLLMIQDRMDGLLCTAFMEFAGLKIDVKEAGRRLQVLKNQLAEATLALDAFIPTDIPFEFNWNSPVHKSAIIFGGTVKYSYQTTYIDPETGELARYKAQARAYILEGGETCLPADTMVDTDGSLWHKTGMVPVAKYLSGKRNGEYKTKQVEVPGELKVKYQDFLYELPGHTTGNPSWQGALTDGAGKPVYGTGKEVIEELSARNIPFLKTLVKKLSLDKEIGTYYVRIDPKTGEASGMLTCVQPKDHMLHHNLNHTNTVTTRLSANNPNLQNVVRADKQKDGTYKSEVKKVFISRFGEDGVMIEADYSQLEVVVQGVLTGDPQLCQDLRDRVDFHCKRVSAKFSIPYEQALDWCKNDKHPDFATGKKERTKCKNFSFQRAYGAGAAAIAYQTGMELEEVQNLIAAEDLLYPGVLTFNSAVETAVKKSAVPFQAANDNNEWRTYRRGFYVTPTGTRYSFRTYDAPAYLQKRGIADSFMPTELKNYPVQGTGGEFVQAILGLLWRHFIANDFYGGKAFLVNTVHDCVWIDCHKSVAAQVAADVKRIMESIPEFYNTRHSMNITVPFPVEVEAGPNMLELSHDALAALAA